MLIRISKFKRHAVPGAWDGSQNPVRYMALDEATPQFGPMDVETWEDFPAQVDQLPPPAVAPWAPGRSAGAVLRSGRIVHRT